MKPILLILSILFLLNIASCKKHDCVELQNSWMIAGISHNVISAYYIIPSSSVQMLFVRDGDTATRNSNVDFDFNVLPSSSGDYSLSSSAGPNQLQILATSYFGNDEYRIYSSANAGGVAHVTVDKGRMTVDVPETWLRNASGTDSVNFSAHVYR